MQQRLMPLFKAAAIVAIVLTLSNAVQNALNQKAEVPHQTEMANINKPQEGPSVAKADSTQTDSLQKTDSQQHEEVIIK